MKYNKHESPLKRPSFLHLCGFFFTLREVEELPYIISLFFGHIEQSICFVASIYEMHCHTTAVQLNHRPTRSFILPG